MLPFSGSSSTAVRVRRDHIFEDSFRALSQDEVGSKPLKGRIQVTFVNEHGMEEAGIDGGGLLKEWMDAICKEVFDPTYGYFVTTGTSGDSTANQVTPSYASGVLSSEHLDGFRFAGRILGKALYEGILVEPRLASPFINKLLGRYNHVDDLKFLDQGLHKGLMSMKRMALSSREADREAVADLGLNFQTNIEAFGAHHDVSLMPDGENVAVTAQNALQYIHLLAHFKLNVLTKAQSEAVLKGFRELIPVCWLRLFNAPEVQLLIGGDGYHPIDLNDLKAHCAYSGGYHPSQPYIKAFWQCVDEFTPREHADFLRFITSCSRQPLLGFSSLNPKICIQKVPHEPYGKLPSAATCMNLLKLPQYDDKETLRSKLLYAISSNAGFDLT
uniref:HECT-type E3 ubiquitin transferase n=1 Tax=Pinguiococcus pyrenoidosus TaxID=172671 RepID=A0A7R9Y9Y8_9STRA|mmetsp:Transcript_1366/g.5873  ORF Transcript_1366/g.5873 Transcript_1366/m.5873 type:complete len:386 (+) Transcript_1366:1-1158(+)